MPFLCPVANLEASKVARAPEAVVARNTVASSTVTSPYWFPALAVVLRKPPPSGTGRRVTKVRLMAVTPAIRSPVTYWARSTACAPISPSAPDPARCFSSRHDMGAAGSVSQSCR